MCLFCLHICSMAIVVCHGFKTKICTRLLLISNLSIQYSDFAIPMDIQKKDVNCFYYVLSVHIKKVKKKFWPSGYCGIRTHNIDV